MNSAPGADPWQEVLSFRACLRGLSKRGISAAVSLPRAALKRHRAISSGIVDIHQAFPHASSRRERLPVRLVDIRYVNRQPNRKRRQSWQRCPGPALRHAWSCRQVH